MFDALTTPEGRQLEWLAARTAAKEAVRELLCADTGIDLLPAEIEILPDERGRPIVAAPAVEDLGAMPQVSLAHAQGEAAALAAFVESSGIYGVGIDIEHLVARPSGFGEAALDALERPLLEPLPASARDEWVTRCWCAKEAAGKAAGSGLSPGRQPPKVAAIVADHEQVLVDVGGRRAVVHTRREQSLIVATTIGEEGGSNS